MTHSASPGAEAAITLAVIGDGVNVGTTTAIAWWTRPMTKVYVVTTTDEGLPVAGDAPPDLVSVDEALQALAKMDERRSQVIELRFFGGLTVERTAVALKVSPDTVMRDSRLAKAWLARELSGRS